MKLKITVLMPVYNGEKYLKEAIESILNQTYADFEFLIINDGSTDKSVEIIKSFSDQRIRFIENEKNLGLIATLNKGIDLALGEYIIRMDSDDVSLPQRLEKQVDFMDKNPDIGVCGSWLTTIGDKKSHLWKFPENSDDIKTGLLFFCPFAHPTVIMRKSVFIKNNLYYSSDFIHGEDYEFWIRCLKYTEFANIQEILLLYRRYSEQISDKHYKIQQNSAKKARLNIFRELNIEPNEEEIEIHNSLVYKNFKRSKQAIIEIENWLNKIIEANDKIQIFDNVALMKTLGQIWFLACRKSSSLGFWAWKTYWKSNFSQYAKIRKSKLFLFWLTCLLKING